MNLIDYTGMLNTYEEYITIIEKLEKLTEYVEIVVIDEKETNYLVEKLKKDIISVKKVSTWWGTKTKAVNNLYRIKASKELFNELKKCETFCKYYDATKYEDIDWDYNETTDFGIDDIAFYGKNGEYLLYTTTHEGFITINEDILK